MARFDFTNSSEALEVAGYPGGTLRGIAFKRAFKPLGGIERIQALARRHLVQQRFATQLPNLALWLDAKRLVVVVDAAPPPSLAATSEPLPEPPTAPPSNQILDTSPAPDVPTPPLPELRLGLGQQVLHLTHQASIVNEEHALASKQLANAEERLLLLKAKVMEQEELVSSRLAFIQNDCLPASNYEELQEQIVELSRQIESNIAKEAAGTGQLLQLRRKAQSHTKWHQWSRSRTPDPSAPLSKSSVMDAELSLRDIVARAHIYVGWIQRVPVESSRPVAEPLLSNKVVPLNRTRRSPLAPLHVPNPSLFNPPLVAVQGGPSSSMHASTSSKPHSSSRLLNIPSTLRLPKERLRSPPPSSFQMDDGISDLVSGPTTSIAQKRNSLPVPSVFENREAIDRRLLSFYKPSRPPRQRPPPLAFRSSGHSSRTNVATQDLDSPEFYGVNTPPSTSPPLPDETSSSLHSQQQQQPTHPTLPVWFDQVLDQFSQSPASPSLPEAITSTSPTSLIGRSNYLNLDLHLPSPSLPPGGEWDVIDGDEASIRAAALHANGNTRAPGPTAKLRKRTSVGLFAGPGRRSMYTSRLGGGGGTEVPTTTGTKTFMNVNASVTSLQGGGGESGNESRMRAMSVKSSSSAGRAKSGHGRRWLRQMISHGSSKDA